MAVSLRRVLVQCWGDESLAENLDEEANGNAIWSALSLSERFSDAFYGEMSGNPHAQMKIYHMLLYVSCAGELR